MSSPDRSGITVSTRSDTTFVDTILRLIVEAWLCADLAMDTATSDIRAVDLTPGSDGDSPVLPELLDHIPQGERIGTVSADGANDTRRCHRAIIDRQATPMIPIRQNGRPCKQDCPGAIAYLRTDRQRPAALERLVLRRPVQGPVSRGFRSAHPIQLSRWIHKMNPSRDLRKKACKDRCHSPGSPPSCSKPRATDTKPSRFPSRPRSSPFQSSGIPLKSDHNRRERFRYFTRSVWMPML